jgi:hypothetical protein
MEQGTFDELLVQEKEVKTQWIANERQGLCREVASAIDSKELAAICGCSYQYIRAMLNGNGERKPWNHEFDGALMILRPDLYAEKVLAFDAEMTGRDDPQKKRALTPQEELDQLRQVLRDMHMDEHSKIKPFL